MEQQPAVISWFCGQKVTLSVRVCVRVYPEDTSSSLYAGTPARSVRAS